MDMQNIANSFSNLDPKNPGRWPIFVQVFAITAISLGVFAGGFYLLPNAQMQELAQLQKKEKELRVTYKTKYHKAVNLNGYIEQMKEMEQSFGTMLRQLPDTTEVAELLEEVSQTGIASGLEFELFSPNPESPREFYAELPIKIRVTGDYHQFGRFVSDVAELNRIVTLHDIAIKPQTKESTNTMIMEAVAKTYRYFDEDAQDVTLAN